MIEVRGERWCIVVPVKTRMPRLKQREQIEKVVILIQLCQFVENVGKCLSNEGLISHRYSHADRPLISYEVFLHINHLIGEECRKICKSRFGLIRQ